MSTVLNMCYFTSKSDCLSDIYESNCGCHLTFLLQSQKNAKLIKLGGYLKSPSIYQLYLLDNTHKPLIIIAVVAMYFEHLWEADVTGLESSSNLYKSD